MDEFFFLVVDPVSRTSFVNVDIEQHILQEYDEWIDLAFEAVDMQAWSWLSSLQKVVVEDYESTQMSMQW